MTIALHFDTFLDAAILAAGGGFVCAFVAVIHFIARQSSTRAMGVAPARNNGTPSWPRAGHYLLLAVFLTAAGIYGSLVPLSYRPLGIHEALERFKEIPYLSLGIRHRADFVENLVLFIPISYCWLAALAVDRRPCWLTTSAALVVVLFSASLSVALEFTQLWFPPRTVSQNDIIAETIGTLIGVGLWLIGGQAIADWVRSYSSSASRKEHVDWLLQAYFMGLLIYSIVPVDLILNVAELKLKYREGKISLVPFSHGDAGLAFFPNLLRDVAIFIPVGMLAATWRAPAERPVRRTSTSVLFGGLAVLAMELAQVFVYTRSTATGDLMTGTLGVLVGAWLVRRWRGHVQGTPPQPGADGPARRVWLWLGLAGLYALLLVVVFCTPFEPIGDPQQIKARFDGFFSVPFADLYRTMDLEALSDVVKKVLFFAPLGSLLGLAVGPPSVRPTIRRAPVVLSLMAAAGVGVLIEMAQVFVPPHGPAITDVIVYTAGAAMGMLVAVRMAGR